MNSYAYEYLGYIIKPHKDHPTSYIIVTSGQGGKIPDSLSGMYTSRTLAKADIDAYLASKSTKDKEDAKTVNKGGSK